MTRRAIRGHLEVEEEIKKEKSLKRKAAQMASLYISSLSYYNRVC